MKRKLFLLIVAILALTLCFSLASCGDNEDGPTEATVKSIEVMSDSYTSTYFVGQSPDFSSLKLKVTYSDGKVETVNASDATIGKIDTSSAGAKVLTVAYKGVTVNVTISVIEPTVTGIKILANTVETAVRVGTTYSVEDMVVEATYNNGTKKSVDIDDLTVTLPDTATEGTKLLKVTYLGFEATIEVTVAQTNVSAMSVYGNTVATEVKVGDTLDTSRLRVEVTYENGLKVLVGASDLTIAALDTTAIGTSMLAISYDGFTLNYPISVYGATSLELHTANIDTKIFLDGSFDTSNVSATVYYSNGTNKTLDITELTVVNNINTSEAGEQKFKVSYEIVSAEITVEVIGVEDVTVNGIANEVLMGRDLVTTGITLTVRYADGVTAKTLTPTAISALDTTTAGNKKIVITYLHGTVDHPVKVCGPVDLSVENLPRFFVGQIPSLDEIEVYHVYNDTNSTKVRITDYTTNLASLNFETEDDKDLIITSTVAGTTLTKTVKLSNKPLVAESLAITAYDKLIKINSDYNTNGIVAEVTYTTGASKTLAVSDLRVVSAIDKATAGEQILKVSYTDENGNTVYAQATVKVLPVASISAVDLPIAKVNVGTDVSFDGITVIVTYSDGTDTITENVNKADAQGLQISAFDKNVIGDQEITISYLGKEFKYTVHFKGIIGIEIVSGTYKDHIREGYGLDISGVEIKATYSDETFDSGKPEKFGATVTSSQNSETKAVTVTATLGTLTDSVTVDKIVYIHSVDALNGTVPSVLFMGEALPLAEIALTVYYNVDGVLVPYLVKLDDAKLDYEGSGTDFDKENGKWATAGDKMLTLIFDKDQTVMNDLGQLVPKYSAVARISIIGITDITLVDGTVPTTVVVNTDDRVNVEKAQFLVTFSDGSYTYVKYGAEELTWNWDNYSTDTVGTTTIIATYSGVDVPITVNVIDRSNPGALIFGAESPLSITARESYKTSFTDSDNVYVVGDDNPFKFILIINALDENDAPVNDMTYIGSSKVYLLNKDTLAVEGEAGEEYVTINESKHTFQFTDAAIGKYFKIVSAPEGLDEYEKELIVKVVDGYNIYNPKELNLITNSNIDIDGPNHQFITDGQATLVAKFLHNEGIEYVNISAAILHGNMNITDKDIPEEYLHTENGKAGLFDEFSVYNRILTNENPTFTLYGNYFSIYSYALPTVVEKGVANNGDAYSSSQLFIFRTDGNAIPTMQAADHAIHTNYKASVVDTGFRDNDPNSNDQAASARHMLGLIALKIRQCEGNIVNTNIEAYYVSLFADYDNTDVNVTDSKLYNAWQGHLHAYNENGLEYDDNNLPGAYYQNIRVKITNSLMAKCGGPVILSQNFNETKTKNMYSGADVDVDDKSELYSYVTGQEAWFVALGATSKASSIIALDQIISGYAAVYTQQLKAQLQMALQDPDMAAAAAQFGITLDNLNQLDLATQYTSKNMIEGVSTINLIMATMPAGDSLDSGKYTDLNGSLSIGNVDNIINLDKTNPAANPSLTQTNIGTGGQCAAPIIQTSGSGSSAISMLLQAAEMMGTLGGTCYANPAAPQDQMLKKVESDYVTHSNPDLSYFFGEYATIYMGGMSVALELYSPTNPDVK